MLARIEKGEARGILACHLDRLARYALAGLDDLVSLLLSAVYIP